jgi:hypothetical protein
LRVTKQFVCQNSTADDTRQTVPWTAVYYLDGLTWTNDNYVQVTGTNSTAPGAGLAICQCEGIQVVQF